MINHINKDKLKIKHLLYIEGANYPNEEDSLYEIIDCLQQQNLLNSQFVKSHLRQVKSRLNGMEMAEMLEYFANKGYFEMTFRGDIPTFKIIKHPWE